MKKIWTVRSAERFSRIRLSKTFFMGDFLYSEIASIEGMTNLPSDPALAIAAGRRLCEKLLEPLEDTFGRIAVRFVVPSLVDHMAMKGLRWESLAWWIDDHLPYSELQFFPQLAAFNIGWHEHPKKTIYSCGAPRGFSDQARFCKP